MKTTYKIVQAELWGNVRDGFVTNDWHTLQTITRAEPLSDRWLLRIVRDLFQGRNFAWTDSRYTQMSRKGIELDWGALEAIEIADIDGKRKIQGQHVNYRGYYVGEVQIITEGEKQCSK